MNPEDAAELEALRRDVAALGGDPNAVLMRVNQSPPATARPRQGTTTMADVGIGDVTTEADTSGYDLTTLEGAGQYDQDVLRDEMRQRKIRENRDMYLRAQENGYQLDPLPGPPTSTGRDYEGPRQREELDFDQRQEDELRAMGMYGITDDERQRNIRRALDERTMTGDYAGIVKYRPSAAGSVATDLNVGSRTGRTMGNVSEDEVRRALQRREELYL